ncbi:hypothetical protein NMY3_01324 [Candidatus Nitrosocosmicus oleophilus]|uniref:Uncharacterized protein n=1 Tax=Candidatus Nitrosocosmicus oleophilus TaxID=1353260 RepID=A0A654LVR8_9ARCH|nr:hypothetical protein NMY3_01324 [Candidatus Nitrosocosmicus oleophilus]
MHLATTFSKYIFSGGLIYSMVMNTLVGAFNLLTAFSLDGEIYRMFY